MSQFPPFFAYVMGFEDPAHLYRLVTDNNGGGVISGINSKSFPDDFAAIAAKPEGQRPAFVAQFYQAKIWNRLQLGGLTSQDVANRVGDSETNQGAVTASELLQRAINSVHAGSVVEDGVIGPATLEAANQTDPDSLLAAFRVQRLLSYQAVVAHNPEDAIYLGTEQHPGPWWRRAEA